MAGHTNGKRKNVTDSTQKSKKRVPEQNFGVTDLRAQLEALGLKIIQVSSDGNCLFRALADQLDGDEDEHGKYRRLVVQYLRDHRDDFEPFLEDGVQFDVYCQTMAVDGTWGGNMELQAASLITQCNICIHLHRQPPLNITNFDNDARMLHLSYHNGAHYNSVRSKEDSCAGPARPVVIQDDANLPASSNRMEVAAESYKQEGRENMFDEETIEEKNSRDEACSCGSKKKYESCCGTISAKSSARFPAKQTVVYSRTRKDRKQDHNSGSTSGNSNQHDGGPPDLGAL